MAEIIRAGADQPTRGEASALAVLAGLPKPWVIIANKILTLGHADSYEIDFIVVEITAFSLSMRNPTVAT